MKSIFRIFISFVLLLGIGVEGNAKEEFHLVDLKEGVALPPVFSIIHLNDIDFSVFNPNLSLNGVMLPEGLGVYTFDFEDLNDTDNIIEGIPDVNNLNSITTLDLVMLHRGLLLEDLTPVQIISADIDRSGSVTTKEMTTLRKLILGIEDAPLVGQPFLVQKDSDFGDLNMFDFVNDFNEYVFDKADVEGLEKLEFEIFQYGNLSEAISEFHKSEERISALKVVLEDQFVSKGEVVKVSMLFSGQTGENYGTGFRLDHPDLDLVNISSAKYASNIITNELSPSQTTVSYLPQKPTEQLSLEFTFRAKSAGRLSNLLQLDHNYENELISDDFWLNKLELVYESSPIEMNEIKVYPNPAKEALFIDNYNTGEVFNISISDMLGREIFQGQIQDEILELEESVLQAKGMLLIRLSNKEHQFTRKVIVI